MSFTTEHKKKFDDLRFYLDANHKDQIRLKGNGGNSILFTYPPEDEERYLNMAQKRFHTDGGFVDVSKILVEYIEDIGWDDFKQYYLDFQTTPNLIFKSDSDDVDLFDLIISRLKEADELGKIPFLIRTGSLFGTGIENVQIMEHKDVMAFKNPLIIFYPSTIENNNLKFLGFKLASKYRCVLID